jgi:hypothetical protein
MNTMSQVVIDDLYRESVDFVNAGYLPSMDCGWQAEWEHHTQAAGLSQFHNHYELQEVLLLDNENSRWLRESLIIPIYIMAACPWDILPRDDEMKNASLDYFCRDPYMAAQLLRLFPDTLPPEYDSLAREHANPKMMKDLPRHGYGVW